MSKRIRVGLSKAAAVPFVTVILLALVGWAFSANAQTETTLHWFSGGDGGNPIPGLVQGSDGNYYGTTVGGGTNVVCSGHCGTIFRISPFGNLTNLYWFSGSDGAHPNRLVEGSDGNFYGTTAYGGTSTNCPGGCGTVFKISPDGSLTSLYSFNGSEEGPDGALPAVGLVKGSDGNFYGITQRGGANGGGTVFRMSPSGSYTNLYFFGGSPNDGFNPNSALVQGSDGNFYGTTVIGGTRGGGIVFRISPSGNYAQLFSFDGGDGLEPNGLVQGIDGYFYGVTSEGGIGPCQNGCGSVFVMTVPLNPPANQISAVQVVGNDIYLSVPSVAGETYQLQYSGSMQPTNWVNVAGVSVTNSIGATLTLTNFGGAIGQQGFYRFDITP